MLIRRVVTSHDGAGRSIVAEDAHVRRCHDYKHIKGFFYSPGLVDSEGACGSE